MWWRHSLSIRQWVAFFIVAILSCSSRTCLASTGSYNQKRATSDGSAGVTVPLIDLSRTDDDDQLVKEIALACSTLGFFQVTGHGISNDLCERFRTQCALYFDLHEKQKKSWKRNSANSRGFFDDELTKQKRDWKECLDVGVPGSRDWDVPDDSFLNACLDGFNQFPSSQELPQFRETIVEYFEACAKLSDRIACLLARGMGLPDNDPFITDLKERHSSYLRMNYYPPCDPSQTQQQEEDPLGISPHKDAGFLTVLLQDDDCHSLQALIEGDWVSVSPVRGAFTINTGDMAQIWSNGKYKAPLHRVLTSPNQKRYSAPFFYNPGYKTFVRPMNNSPTKNDNNNIIKYDPVLWGYFRAVRFAGDLTNLGVEIQTEDFEKANPIPSAHVARQEEFHERKWYDVPFDVDGYRELLRKHPD